MIRMGLVGLGKMGISHLAMARAHPMIDLVAVCDSASYMLDVIKKGTGLAVYSDFAKMLAAEKLDAVIIATPSRFHVDLTRAALDANLHVFCEKPFCLKAEDGARLAELAQARGRVNQVGYHFRFVRTFGEAKRLITGGAIGKVHNIRAEAFGPVVVRQKNATWRSKKSEGGGCLYDYASHAIDLMNYLVGAPQRVGGTTLNTIFSHDVEDEVHANFFYDDDYSGQVTANWSDESQRKMSLKLHIWGTNGRIVVDRQEVQLFVRDAEKSPIAVRDGWTTTYTPELTNQVYYYLRGEEYSSQIDHFAQSIAGNVTETVSTFATAVDAARVAEMMVADAAGVPREVYRPRPVRPVSGVMGWAKARLS